MYTFCTPFFPYMYVYVYEKEREEEETDQMRREYIEEVPKLGKKPMHESTLCCYQELHKN